MNLYLKNVILALAIILLAGILTLGLDHYFKSERGEFFILEKGKTVPDFEFDGQSLHDIKAERVIIHFWASWCAPCVVEFPELIKLAEKDKNTVIIAFSSDRHPTIIDRFLDQHDFKIPDNFKIVWDKKGQITRDKFSVFRLPESFVLDGDFIVKNHIIGAYEGWTSF